jgi:DNA-binding NarL/FixJ family response regulator
MLVVSRGVNILVIDACSVPEWPEVVRQWNDVGHRTILVVEDNCDIGGVELRSLHFGVRGIVRVSDDFIEQMLEAIKCVAKGQVFATGETLDQFYCGFRRSRSGSPSSSLSFREEQTLELLTKGFSNKRIGHVLGISERTAKFHVCNILRKLQVGSRRELMNKYAETA